MFWPFLVLGIIILSGIGSLIHRWVLKDEKDFLAFGFAFQVFGTLFFIPILLVEWQFPSQPEAWILAVISSVLWAALGVVGFKAQRFTEVSLRSPIGKSKMLWVIFFAALLLGEAVTQNKIVGSALIFLGVVLVTFKTDEPLGGFGDLGVKLTLIAALMGGAVAIVDKVAMSYFQPGIYGFIEYLLPMIWLGLLVPQSTKRLSKLLKGKGKWVIAASLLAVIWSWMLFKAYQLADVSTIAPLLELSVIVTVIGGFIILGERKDIIRRIIGTLIIIVGALIIKG